MDMYAVKRIDAAATGERIRDMLKAQGIKVSEVADKLLVTRYAVYKWQRGNLPDIDNLFRLSRLLGTRLSNIVVLREPAGSQAESLAFDLELYSNEDRCREQKRRIILYTKGIDGIWVGYGPVDRSA